jgi:hypothetical protein
MRPENRKLEMIEEEEEEKLPLKCMQRALHEIF